MGNSKELIKKKVNKKELRDAGLAAILLCLITYSFSAFENFSEVPKIIKLTGICVVLTMVIPKALYPFAIIWYTLTNFLGFFMSRILLSIIYFVVVMPVGILRRIIGKDTLKLKQYGKSARSAFIERNKAFSKTDLQTPY